MKTVFICTEKKTPPFPLLFSHSQFLPPSLFPHTLALAVSPSHCLSCAHWYTCTHTEHVEHMAISLHFEGLLWSYGTRIDWRSDELASPEPCDYLSLYFKQSAREGGLNTHHSLRLSVSYTLIHEERIHKQTRARPRTNGDNEMSLHTESLYLRQAALQSWQVSGEC